MLTMPGLRVTKVQEYDLKLALIFILCLVAVIFLGAQIIFQNMNFLDSHRRVTHTLAVQVLTDDILINAIEGSSAVRGYAIGGNPVFLKPYEQMRNSLMSQYDNLARLTADNPVQTENLIPLKEALRERLEESARQIRIYQEESQASAQRRISDGFGRNINERIDAAVTKIVDEENRLLVARENRVNQESNKLFIFDGLAIAGMLLMIVWIAYSMANGLRFRETMFQERNLLNAELESRNIALEAVNTALVKSDQFKNEFLSSMSHELRTPLNSIIGFSNIMRLGISGPLNDDQKKQIGMVEDSAIHLLALINDLLDLSRIEAGEVRLHIERIDLCEVARDAFSVLTPLAAKKALILNHQCTENQHIYVWADRRKVYQVILNLVNNAIKFSDRGVISFDYQVREDKCEVSVSDQGMGIPPDQLPMLFRAFHQVDSSYRKVHEGTGLGLYLCKKILEMMGGSIGVKSEPGVGSTFTFVIPIHQENVTS